MPQLIEITQFIFGQPLSSAARWLTRCAPAGRRRSWRVSSNRRHSRSGTGWHSLSVTPGRGDGGLTTAEREELNRLRRENRQLRLEREILQRRPPGSLGRRIRSRERSPGRLHLSTKPG